MISVRLSKVMLQAYQYDRIVGGNTNVLEITVTLRSAPKTLALLLALLVAHRVFLAWTTPPDVGHWRSSTGRDTYTDAYDAALAVGPTPYRSVYVPTRFGTAHVVVWEPDVDHGETPILLTPGRASGAPMWNELLPYIGNARTVYAVDAIGDAGLSAQSSPITSSTDQAQWLSETLEGLGVDSAHVVGHSFGGATSAALAVERPDLVASIALIEPAFTLVYPPPATFFWGTVALLPVPQSLKDRALAEIGGTTAEEVRQDDPVSTMIDLGSRHFSAALPTPKPLNSAQLERLSMPVYVAIADTDSLAGGEVAAERARQAIPDAIVHVWPNTTHSLPFQVPQELSAELESFWAAGSGGSVSR